MPIPPKDNEADDSPVSLADSLRAAAMQTLGYRQRLRQRTPPRWRRIVGLAGTMLFHLFLLFAVVLGPAYEVGPAHDADTGDALKVRLIELPKPPPPPPPVRGVPPREIGPTHHGNLAHAPKRPAHNAAPAARSGHLARVPLPAMARPVISIATAAQAPQSKPPAAPVPPQSLPKPAPAPDLQPIPVASRPPLPSMLAPQLARPVPPRFQPEPVRKPQPEGNQAMPSPASLAMPDLPAQTPPQVNPPSIAVDTAAPPAAVAIDVAPAARAEPPAAPPIPDLQAVPLPAQPAPTVKLQATITPPSPTVERPQVQVQASAASAAEPPQLAAVPVSAAERPRIEPPATPSAQPAPTMPTIAAPDLARPQLDSAQSTAPTAAANPAQAEPSATAEPAPAASSAPAEQAADSRSSEHQPVADQAADHAATAASDQPDQLSSAPNATPQGSDHATPGRPDGQPGAPHIFGKDGSIALPAAGSGSAQQGQAHGDAAGNAASGAQGQPGSYVQLRPHGDTDVLDHRVPNIGYKSTRFDKDWTPLGESSVDTALRHAVEKTTLKHTFQLPRGVRIECVLMPLLPMSLFGCGNGDPPPKPLDDPVYQRLHLGSTHPLVPPEPAAAARAPAPLKLDNSVQCATARVAGGPPPPGCAPAVIELRRPASSSSSWVPASDQWH